MAKDGNGHIEISLLDIYNKGEELDNKLDTVLQHVEKIPDHERRIRNLERTLWSGAGVGALLAAAVAALRLVH